MRQWMEALRQYGELLRIELSYASKVAAPVEVQESAIRKITRKTTINVLRRKVDERAPFTPLFLSPLHSMLHLS